MKTVIILAFIMLFGSCRPGQHSDVVLSSLDRQTLYPALFNVPAQNEWCQWEPSPSEKDSTNVSSDGLCHTRLDTILYYADAGTNRAVIIFGTYEFENGGMVFCHACNPMVSIAVAQKSEQNAWRVINFIKNFGTHGEWSAQPDYRIGRLGRNDFLVEDAGYSNQGIVQNWTFFYHLPSLAASLTLESMDNSMMISDINSLNEWADSIKDISEGNTTSVIVTRQGTWTEEGKEQQSGDQVTEYVLNDSNIFRPVSR
jgi:hypothetical protein